MKPIRFRVRKWNVLGDDTPPSMFCWELLAGGFYVWGTGPISMVRRWLLIKKERDLTGYNYNNMELEYWNFSKKNRKRF